jgi:2-polyprenyl-3-methyl-5-hydroxy-6-metoxy-1,4-benzoquinol methylase
LSPEFILHADPWNHNIHYHDIVLSAVPPSCRRALDVGCGEGLLARKLARRCDEVVAIDADCDTVSRAQSSGTPDSRITFLKGDVMTQSLSVEGYDLITAIATLHHLPLISALKRFRDLLTPGGTLAIIGLYRLHTLEDYAWAAAGLPASRILRFRHGHDEVCAPIREPQETLREIRNACDAMMPGAAMQRRLLFRYSLIWRKP